MPASSSDIDLSRLQGVWRQVAFAEDGVANPPDHHGGMGALTTIEADRFSVRTPGGVLLLEGRFELDATTTPASITWIDAIGEDAGKRLPACYRLDRDRFVFVAADEGMPRPTHFDGTLPGQTMRGFVRHRAVAASADYFGGTSSIS